MPLSLLFWNFAPKCNMKTRLRKLALIAFASLVSISVGSSVVARDFLYNYYSNDAAVDYLVRHAETHSKKRCARYVRLAIKAGGCPTFGQPPSACDYDLFLPDLGFEQVDASGYVPRRGDIVVFSAIKGHKHGHICMYDGKRWVSDFKQRSMFSAEAYRHAGTHTFWRRPDGAAWRKISTRSWKRIARAACR